MMNKILLNESRHFQKRYKERNIKITVKSIIENGLKYTLPGNNHFAYEYKGYTIIEKNGLLMTIY